VASSRCGRTPSADHTAERDLQWWPLAGPLDAFKLRVISILLAAWSGCWSTARFGSGTTMSEHHLRPPGPVPMWGTDGSAASG
jgi:hypothetical protein